MREIKDLIIYLEEIDKLAQKLNKEQKEKLASIIGTILTLLVALKKQSNLGCISFNFKD